MDGAQRQRRRLPSHGTVIAYLALFLVLGGTGYAASQIGGAVKVTCSAKREHRKVACKVVGKAKRGPAGPQGSRGPQGATGPSGGEGPTTFTQPPAYTVDPNNNPNYLTAFVSPTPNPYFEAQRTVAQDSSTVTDAHNDVITPLLSPSQIGGTAVKLSSVEFCINIGPNSNPSFTGTSTVSVDKATVYEIDEPKPAGGAGSGDSNAEPPPYESPVPLLQQTYTGETMVDDCLTASASTPQPVNPDGYLVLAVTLGLTTSGGPGFGTNPIAFGRVTTTYGP